jgi:glycerol-3-phosphate O-acyltransferase
MTSKQKEGKTVHIIPVTVNYERIFEIRNLATEMVSGDVPHLNMLQLIGMIGK